MSFSIIICTFNQVQSLKNTLKSINRLIVPRDEKVELVIIDNNSDDETRTYCEHFAKISKLPFKYCFEPKQGLSHARNRGIEEASGEILIFTDDDVVVPVNWLIEYAKDFEQDSPDCVFGRIIPEWSGFKPKWFDDALKPAYALLDYGQKKFLVGQKRFEFYGANFAIRRGLLMELGGFDPHLGRTKGKLYIGEERKIFIKLMELKKKIIYNPQNYVYHVIPEHRKNKSYLKKYYLDIASSLVYFADTNPKRQLLGIPYFRIIEFIKFYFTFLPKIAVLLCTGQFNKLFTHQVQFIRTNRMVSLYIRKIFVPHRSTKL